MRLWVARYSCAYVKQMLCDTLAEHMRRIQPSAGAPNNVSLSSILLKHS